MKKKTEKKSEIPQQKLDATTARRVLDADLGNLLKRVQSGVPLTAGQRALIENAGQQGGHSPSGLRFAANQAELAAALGCTRQRIAHWIHRHDAPKPSSDGRHDVLAWRKYLAAHGKLENVGEDGEGASQTQARAEQLLIQNDRLRLKLKREKEQLIPKLVAQQVFGKLLVAAKSRCYTSIIRFVTLARMAENTAAAMAAVKTEMDGIWKSLTDSKWLKE